MKTGPKLRAIVRTCGDAVSSDSLTSGATRQTNGTGTATTSALPATDPQARMTASRGNAVPEPNTTSAAIIVFFFKQKTAYEIRNRRWLFRTPRHHADNTVRPVAGNKIRTSA